MDCTDWVQPSFEESKPAVLERWAAAEAHSETCCDDLRQQFRASSPSRRARGVLSLCLIVCVTTLAISIVRGCFDTASETGPMQGASAPLMANR